MTFFISVNTLKNQNFDMSHNISRGNCNFHHILLIVLYKSPYGQIFAVTTCWWSNLLQFLPLVHLINYLAPFKVKLIARPTCQCFILSKKIYKM
jgi:hypothetical protein